MDDEAPYTVHDTESGTDADADGNAEPEPDPPIIAWVVVALNNPGATRIACSPALDARITKLYILEYG